MLGIPGDQVSTIAHEIAGNYWGMAVVRRRAM